MTYTVTAAHDGQKLLDYLRKTLCLSRAEITALKGKEEGIVLNGVRVTVRAILHEGDVLVLDRADGEAGDGVLPRPMPVDILYEDDDLIAVNKPAGIPTHPSHGHQEDTLANGLAYLFERRGVPFVFRAVNRLDRDTAGVVLVAKNRGAAFLLSRQLTEGLVEKTYLAVVTGTVGEAGTVEKNIRRREESKMERTVCPSEEGQYARTDYALYVWLYQPFLRPCFLSVASACCTAGLGAARPHLTESSSMIIVMISSAETFSATASKVSFILWRRTGYARALTSL